MKRLSLIAMLIITLTTGAVAHEGSIGLYTDLTGTDCDMTFTPFLSYEIVILYYRSDEGPNGILSAQFKIELLKDTLTDMSDIWDLSHLLTEGLSGRISFYKILGCQNTPI